jgi:predicted PurR-regulated permease PerM
MKRLERWRDFFFVWGSIVLVVATLYFAQAVLLPVVFAILLSFTLAPLATWLERRGLGRIWSTLLVTSFACLLIGVLIGIVMLQVQSLATEIPNYKTTITNKIETVYESGRGAFADLSDTVAEISDKLKKMENVPEQEAPPVPVTVEQGEYMSMLQTWVGTTLEALLQIGVVLILVIFILLNREDLRNRFIRLSGTKSLTSTTKALDDAEQRISRYLVAQLIINASYGFTVAVGLAVIGIPYAMLWGFLTAVLRYIPYIGPWLGAAFPIVMAVAVFEEWMPLVWVVLLFVALELFSNNVMETWLYGRSIGVSNIAVLVTAVFWTWIWGPLGLVLSTPMTACLVVLARYVPAFNFLEVLLGDQPVLPTHITLFQRLLAKDDDEAWDLVQEYPTRHPGVEIYDEVFLPALQRAQIAHDRGDLPAEDLKYIHRTVEQFVEELPSSAGADATQGDANHGQAEEPGEYAGEEADDRTSEEAGEQRRPSVVGCAVRSAADDQAAQMFGKLLDRRKFRYDILTSDTVLGELRAHLEDEMPAAVCLFATPPGGVTQTRLLCKRLRREFPDLKILVLCWRRDDDDPRLAQRFEQCADSFAANLLELRGKLHTLLPVLAAELSSETEPTAAR